MGCFRNLQSWRQLASKGGVSGKTPSDFDSSHFTAATSMPREGRELNNFTQPTSWSREVGKKDAGALQLAFQVDSPRELAVAVHRYEVPFAIGIEQALDVDTPVRPGDVPGPGAADLSHRPVNKGIDGVEAVGVQ